jgi:hypothetical protein
LIDKDLSEDRQKVNLKMAKLRLLLAELRQKVAEPIEQYQWLAGYPLSYIKKGRSRGVIHASPSAHPKR